jgi:hypothetical protein
METAAYTLSDNPPMPSSALGLTDKTSKSILAKTNTSLLLKLYERYSVSEIARKLGPALSILESNRLKKAIWRRLKRVGYEARASGDAIRATKVGRPRRNYLVRFHQSERPVDKWKILELKSLGKSTQQIAKILNRAYPSIYLALRRMGFPTGISLCYSFGEPFDGSALRRLHLTSGLNVTEMSRQLQIKFSTLEPHLAPRQKRRALSLDGALKAASWRKSLFASLMSNASRHPGDDPTKYAQSRIIVTFFPNVRERYAFLHQVFDEISQALRQNPDWSIENLQQYLCEQALLENVGKRSGNLFSKFLPWAPELAPFLAGKLDILRGVHHQRLAFEAIATSLGTTPGVVSSIVNPAQAVNIKPISAKDVRGLISNAEKEAKLAAAEKKASKYDDVGRDTEDEIWAMADELYHQKWDWDTIKARCDQIFSINKTVKAYQEGRRRYLKRQKPTK